ncbi:MAG: hypothetical protein K2L46_04185 [Paramuribaculum sp.]|nr:hypothetical protein [Paramuribaculum sp.]
MERIEFHNRIVSPITSESGQRDYYEHLNYWRVCYHNKNTLILPTKENALEYMRLKSESEKFYLSNDKESRKKLRQYQLYDTQYDWRPQKTRGDGYVGLISPTGEQLLPDSFADAFTQFDAINGKPIFVPVSNGEEWALVSLTNPPVLMTDFQYSAIIPERWSLRLFFVQDRATKKWGALSVSYPFLHKKPYTGSLPLLKTLMPPIADDIFEDELMTEEESTTFFMTRRGDKVGILTDYGYSDIIFDRYETHNAKCSFRLIRNGRSRARRADYWHPDGKKCRSKPRD